MEHVVQIKDITDPSQLSSKTVDQVNRMIQYVDGLGRPLQTVMFSGSPDGNDIVQHIAYDEFGREKFKFLPYVHNATNGAYKTDAAASQIDFYHPTSPPPLSANVAKDTYPKAETVFEPSPLNRVLEQGSPGADWQIHKVKFEYTANSTNEVYEWEITTLGDCKLTSGHYYDANELYVTITKDENWSSTQSYPLAGTMREYKDKLGRVVLKRTYNMNSANNGVDIYDTYYVYDDFGNLRFVIPPEGIKQLGSKLTDINEGPDVIVATTNLILTGNSSKKYYYCPGVLVTLSPEFTGLTGFQVSPYPVNADIVDQYLFTYKYDDRQRMIEKKVPGAEPVYMVYDKRDRLVLTQDGVQRASNTWLFTKYDALNRPVTTGEYTNTTYKGQVNMQGYVDGQIGSSSAWYETRDNNTGNIHGYDNESFPELSDADSYLTITYYDNYDGFDASLNYPSGPDLVSPYDDNEKLDNPKGQVTGGKVRYIDDTGTKWLNSAVYYDKKYRTIYAASKNHLGGLEVSFMYYNFVGDLINQRTKHTTSSDATGLTIDKTFDYDHMSRLNWIKYTIDGNEQKIVTNDYNEIGELITKYLHGDDTNYKQKMDYSYNIRGWLTQINDPTAVGLESGSDYFGMKLKYNETPTAALSSARQYNGNISEIQWKNAQTATLSAYGFTYDKLNRLKTSHYGEGTLGTTNSGAWDEDLSYDFNGNIMSLVRDAAGTNVDNLNYNYSGTGNKLNYVTDGASYSGEENHFKDGNPGTSADYTYDANGNMNQDKNKGISSIAYNHLNLPKLITFANGNSIEYIYDATGVKLRTIVKESGQPNKTTDYAGGFVYEGNVRKFMSTEEGRIMLESTQEYQYHMKDHLGNVRLTFTTASSAQQTSTYLATMETEVTTLEAATFNNIEATQTEDKVYNHTPGGKASARLNAVEDRVMGPSMTLQVMPGDTIRMKVQAKYFKKAKSKDPIAGMASIVAASMGAGTISEAPQIAQGIQETLGLGQAGLVSKDNTIPKAYINYLFFDKENTFKKGGFKQVSEAALGSFEELTLEYVPEEEGTMMIYTANQTAEDLDVYMDDLTILHTEGPIIRVDDYYPFGMTYHTSERTGYTTNRFLYNGKELQTDLDLDWYDYGARMYDATIGRWNVVDPLADSFSIVSPYNYVLNNPLILIDPNGEDIVFYNKNGGEIARIIYEDIDEEYDLDIDISLETPIVIDPMKIAEQLGVDKLDAVGVGADVSATFGGGGHGGVEFVYFLDGEDKGNLYAYHKKGLNAGFEGGAGVYGFGAVKNQEDVNAESWEGKFNSYAGGFKYISGSYFWSNTADKGSAFPGQSDRILSWEGVSVGAAWSGRLQAGFKWSLSWYKLFSSTPIISKKK